MKVYDRICVNDIDNIIKESDGDDIRYIRDGDRSERYEQLSHNYEVEEGYESYTEVKYRKK